MQVIQIPDIDNAIPVGGGRDLEPGKEYLSTNAFAGLMLISRMPVTVDGKEWPLRLLLKTYSIEFDRFDPEEDWNNKDIWLFRGGGFGDLLLLTPLIRELRNRWPETWIHVACGEQYQDVFNGLDVIVEKLPIPYDKNTRIDALISFEDIVEGDPRSKELVMPQLFASQAGITLTDIKPEYRLATEEAEWALDNYPPIETKDGGVLPRVGIQLLASALYRTYTKMDAVMIELAKHAQVFLVGKPGQIELIKPVPNLTNLMDHKLSFRQSVALISTCDICVSPDSALVHVCAALDIPCVGLYGPFPAWLRQTSFCAYPIDGVASCSPCFFHADLADQFPVGKPCSNLKKCVALESIPVEDVVKRVLTHFN